MTYECAGQISLEECFKKVDLDFKIAAVYEKVFSVKKFRDLIIKANKEGIMGYIKSHIQGGCLSAIFGWSESNYNCVVIDRRGVHFEDGRGIHFGKKEYDIYSYEEIADMLIAIYAEVRS